MHTIKKITIIIICLALIGSFSIFSFAEESSEKAETTERDVKVKIINNEQKENYLKFTNETGTPTIIEGRTLLPIRFIAESLGATVSWREFDRSVHIFRNGLSIIMFVDKDDEMQICKFDVVNSAGYISKVRTQKIGAKPMIINDRTYIPLRAVCEAMSFDVSWDDPTSTVTINSLGKDLTKGSDRNEIMAKQYVDYEGMFASSGGGFLKEVHNLRYGSVKLDFGELNGGPLVSGKVTVTDEEGNSYDAVKNGYTFLKQGDYKVNVDELNVPKGYAIDKNASFTIPKDLAADAQTVKLWSKTVQKINGLSDIENLEKEVTLNPTVEPADAVDKTINYSSSNYQVVTVDKNGTLKPIGFGSAQITATAGDAKATINVTVPLLLAVESTKTIKVGDLSIPNLSQKSGLLTLESSDPSVASVEESVTAASSVEFTVTGGKKAGTATITVKYQDEKVKDFKVVVNKPVSDIEISNDTVKATLSNDKFVQGEGQKDITINVKPTDATNPSFSISDTWNHDILRKVEKTDKGIHIEFKPKKGETTITVKAGDVTKDIKVVVE